MMIKFDEAEKRKSLEGALLLRGEIEKIADEIYKRGFKEIYFLGIGGTLASGMQAQSHFMMNSSLPVYTLSAAEYAASGYKRVREGSIIIFSSVSGTTAEIIAAVQRAKKAGAAIWAFLDNPLSPLVDYANWMISYPENEQLKFFMASDRLMYNAGEFPDYHAYNEQVEKNLANTLVKAAYTSDEQAAAWAKAHYKDPLHYFIGAGILWGAIYSYAMCYMEEQHWMHTKSIHAAELFHGTLEIIEEDTPITCYIGEDAQRSLSLRVAEFLPKVCKNYTLIDSADYPSAGIEEKFRSRIAHHIIREINDRIDIHLERLSGHDMQIRRYYRKLDY